MKSIVILVFSTLSLGLHSQVIKPSVSWDGVLDYSFEKDFIAEKRIKRINTALSSKQPSQKIKPSSEQKFYEFDSEGFQIEYYNRKRLANLDLITHDISSFKHEKIRTYTQRDEVGYYRKYFTYLSDTTLVSTYRSESYHPDERTVDSDSTFINLVTLVHSDNCKKTINKNGVHIKSEKTQIGDLGMINSKTLEYKLSQKMTTKTYIYNESGLVSEVSINMNGAEKRFTYFYDAHDVIRKIETWKNNSCIKRLEFIYNAKGWLDSTLLQNTENNHLKITKFTYILFS